MAKKLNLGEITPTSLSLQTIDRSMTFPKGIIEDVLVKVDKYIFLMDFVVLDMEEGKEEPIILGRPFLATGQALIDVKNRELTLRVGEDQEKFKLYKSMEFPNDANASCMRIDTLTPSRVELLYDFGDRDSLEKCGTKPVIISLELDKDMEVKLLSVLEKNLEASAWSINDMKGISPSMCMHKILMEEEHVSTIEHQRWLNPAMKEVVKKEVLKWL